VGIIAAQPSGFKHRMLSIQFTTDSVMSLGLSKTVEFLQVSSLSSTNPRQTGLLFDPYLLGEQPMTNSLSTDKA
jgi:hypothetical protein